MFAVIKTGGKQYKVAENTVLTVEKLNAEEGEIVSFDDVLMLGGDSPVLGAPNVDGASVSAEVLEQKRGPKTIKFVKRRRKSSSKRRRGHRQYLTVVRVNEILTNGAKPSKKAAAKKDDAKADKAVAAAAAGAVAAEAVVEGTRPANLLTEAQGEADDLKRISGVGPKLETLLHENGVFHFWQIAEWTKSEISYMDDQLSFKGRIERDNWIEQAKTLASEAK